MFSFKSNRLRSGSGTNKHTVWAVTHIMGPIMCTGIYANIQIPGRTHQTYCWARRSWCQM